MPFFPPAPGGGVAGLASSSGSLVQGAQGQTLPRWLGLSATLALVSQQLYLASVQLPAGVTLSSISFVSAAAIVTPTHQIFGLYDDQLGSSAGVAYGLLAQTTDDGANAWGGNVPKTLNLTAQYKTTRAGCYYLGILEVAATPSTLRSIVVDGITGALAPIICGSSTASVSALPNPAAAPTFGAGNDPFAWVA